MYYPFIITIFIVGYDHRLNWRVTCPVFDDILKYMANIVNGVPDTPRVHLRLKQ